MTRGPLMMSLVLLTGCRSASGAGDSTSGGAALFAQHGCAVCHGKYGEGHGPIADAAPQDFRRRRDALAGIGRAGVARVIGTGRGRMPSFRHLSDDDRLQLAAFVLDFSQQPSRE